jgi:hypothetical protein
MTFKQWVNSLPLANLMVLARQVGFKDWNQTSGKGSEYHRRQISSFLIKSPEAKEMFTSQKLGEIKVSEKPDYVCQ